MFKSNFKKRAGVIITMGAIGLLTACTTNVTEPYVADWKPVAPKIASLLDAGKTIRATDGSFTLIGGGDPVNISKISSKVLLETPGLDLDDFKKIVAGRPSYNVRVKIAGQPEELYGILAFYSVGSTADTSTLRAWRIEIPDEAIAKAQGGGLGYATGDYVFQASLPTDTSEKWKSGIIWSDVGDKKTVYYPSKPRNAHSYVLWLSDYPLITE